MTSRRSLPPGSRGLRLSDAPSLSVVVASQSARPVLEACLRALVAPCRARGIEVVVARACGVEEFQGLQEAWPAVLWMPAADGATGTTLRVAGLSAADGDIVALVDDRDPLDEPWVAELAVGRRGAAPPGGRPGG